MPALSQATINEALKDVIDPELGVNVVDLGLVYGIHIDNDASLSPQPAVAGAPIADDGSSVVVDMTLTTPACPLTDLIEEQVDDALRALGVGQSKVQWVWSPPWGMDMITDEGREQLRMVGFNF